MPVLRRVGMACLCLAAWMADANAEDLVVARAPEVPTATVTAPAMPILAVVPPPSSADGLATPAPQAARARLDTVAPSQHRRRALVKRALPKLALLKHAVPPPVLVPWPYSRRLVKGHLSRLVLLPLSLPQAAAPVAPNPEPRTLTITLAGDLGFGGHMQPVRKDGAVKQGGTIPWSELTARIRPLIDGDLNFANLETVVTERNDLRPDSKTFNFRSHPDGVRHFASIGINLLSTANNHSMDFGAAGALDTIEHLDRIVGAGRLRAHAGLGRNRDEAGRAHLIAIRDRQIAFSAIGIVTSGFPLHRAGDSRPGQMSYQSADDFTDVTRRLQAAPAAYRILSVHHGIERQVQTDATAIRKLRYEAVLDRGIDLVVGHHAHVVQGIEMVGGKLIFYGLGNFLHPGMQNMATHGLCRDYGLFARLHLATDDSGHFRVRAIEVVPLTDMHARPSRMSGGQAGERVQVLNYLAGGLDDSSTGSRGVRFAVRADSTGLHCMPGAESDAGRVGVLCQGWTGPDVLSAPQRSRIAGSCGYIGPQTVARGTLPSLRPIPASIPATPTPRRAARSGTDASFLTGN